MSLLVRDFLRQLAERLFKWDYNELWSRNYSLILRLMLRNKLFNRIQTKIVTLKKNFKIYCLIYIFQEISYNSKMYMKPSVVMHYPFCVLLQCQYQQNNSHTVRLEYEFIIFLPFFCFQSRLINVLHAVYRSPECKGKHIEFLFNVSIIS